MDYFRLTGHIVEGNWYLGDVYVPLTVEMKVDTRGHDVKLVGPLIKNPPFPLCEGGWGDSDSCRGARRFTV